MRVLIDHHLFPFVLAHGGVQIQIEQTFAALARVGVEAEYLRWWDSRQRGDLIHFFGPASLPYLQQAQRMDLPVVLTSFLSQACNRTCSRLRWEGRIVRAVLAAPLGKGVLRQLRWQTFSHCAQNIVGLSAERTVLETMYRVPGDRISVVPLGLSETYQSAGSGSRGGDHLICTGTIAPVKYSIELAQLARAAESPILFVGRPFHQSDPYWLRFKTLIDDRWVRYHPHVEDEAGMVSLLKAARGYVLMSHFENWSLSAHEAAACHLPLLVRDQKWSRECFGDEAHYFRQAGFNHGNIEALRNFHAKAPTLPAPRIQLHRWHDVALQLKAIYERVLITSR